MKKLFLIPLILLFCSIVGGQTSTHNARRIRSGTAVPTMNCSPGPSYTDFYLRTTTDVLYYCSAANTWSVFSTAGGGAIAWGTITGTLSAQTDLQSALDLKAPLASPAFTGTPTLPTGTIATTQSAGDSTTKLATTAFVTTADNLKANLISPSFTTPTLGVASATSITVSANATQITNNGDVNVALGRSFAFGNRGGMQAGGSDGVVQLRNDGNSGFDRLQFGGTTSSFPAWKRSGTTLAARLADDSADSPISASGTTLSSASAPVTFSNAAYQSCIGFTSTAGGVLTCTASTAKVKQGFQFFRNGLDVIRLIQPQTFSYRADTPYFDGGKKHLGLVAENLQQANPLLASTTGAGVLQPEPMALHAIEIDAIKALDARVTTLEKENKRLRALLRRKR